MYTNMYFCTSSHRYECVSQTPSNACYIHPELRAIDKKNACCMHHTHLGQQGPRKGCQMPQIPRTLLCHLCKPRCILCGVDIRSILYNGTLNAGALHHTPRGGWVGDDVAMTTECQTSSSHTDDDTPLVFLTTITIHTSSGFPARRRCTRGHWATQPVPPSDAPIRGAALTMHLKNCWPFPDTP